MYVGNIVVRGIIDGNIYLRVESTNNSTALVIPKGGSIVALCDPEVNTGNSVPSLNRFSYDEIISNINQEDENDLWFDIDLRYICGISIV